MVASRSVRAFERLLVASVIGVILALSAIYQGRLANDIRRLSFEVTAEYFVTGVAAVRAYTYIHPSADTLAQGIELHNALPGAPAYGQRQAPPTRVFVNQHGWPAASEPEQVHELSVEACVQLWYALLHQPPRAVIDGAARDEYQVSLTEQGLCRYQPQGLRQRDAHFSYSPITGAVTLVSAGE